MDGGMDIEYKKHGDYFCARYALMTQGALLVGFKLQDASHLGGPRVHEARGREWTHLLRGREAQLERDEELGAAGQGLRLRRRGRRRASPGKTCEGKRMMWANLNNNVVSCILRRD